CVLFHWRGGICLYWIYFYSWIWRYHSLCIWWSYHKRSNGNGSHFVTVRLCCIRYWVWRQVCHVSLSWMVTSGISSTYPCNGALTCSIRCKCRGFCHYEDHIL